MMCVLSHLNKDYLLTYLLNSAEVGVFEGVGQFGSDF